MQGYNGPAALNEGIRAIGDVFSPETAMNRQNAIMYKQQFEQTMKPLTLDEIASKTAPDLWGPMQKLAEANGIVEENNGVKFIRQGNLRQFHDDLGKNKIWQAQLLDESSKLNKSKLDEITPQFETAKKQWEASIAIYKYKAEQEMAKAKEEGRPPDVPALMKLEEQIKEAQNKYPVYKQMMTLGQQREAIMGSYKKRITSMGLLDEGFKKDVEKYGEPDAIKIALNPEYRRQLDMQRMKDEARIKADEIRYTEQVKAGLKEDKPATDIQEYEYARKQGYKGSYVDWQRVKQKPTSPNDTEDKATKEYEKRFSKIESSAIKQAADMTRAKYGSTALNITTNSDGTVSFGSTGNEEADKYYEATKERLKAKSIKDAVQRKALPKDYDNSPTEQQKVPKQDYKALVDEAAAAIKAGADPLAVKKRLREKTGYTDKEINTDPYIVKALKKK